MLRIPTSGPWATRSTVRLQPGPRSTTWLHVSRTWRSGTSRSAFALGCSRSGAAGRKSGVETETAPAFAFARPLAAPDPERSAARRRAGELVAARDHRAVARNLFLREPKAVGRDL